MQANHAEPGGRFSTSGAAAAYDNLQAAILRLATRPTPRAVGSERQELNARVERALEAYREYMRSVEPASA
ncbi:MAG: hypothetical protein WD751_07145 [Anaerolineales bacterium]